MMERPIAICGMPGSGKGEIVDNLIKKGGTAFSMGDVVREWFSETQRDRDPVETGKYANEERERYGKDIWARRLVYLIEKSEEKGSLVIIEGMRSMFEYRVFKKKWKNDLLVVSVHSSPDTRYERLRSRGRSDDPVSRAQFDERDRRELGWGLGDVIALSDEMLINEGGLDDISSEADRIFEKAGGDPK